MGELGRLSSAVALSPIVKRNSKCLLTFSLLTVLRWPSFDADFLSVSLRFPLLLFTVQTGPCETLRPYRVIKLYSLA